MFFPSWAIWWSPLANRIVLSGFVTNYLDCFFNVVLLGEFEYDKKHLPPNQKSLQNLGYLVLLEIAIKDPEKKLHPHLTSHMSRSLIELLSLNWNIPSWRAKRDSCDYGYTQTREAQKVIRFTRIWRGTVEMNLFSGVAAACEPPMVLWIISINSGFTKPHLDGIVPLVCQWCSPWSE